MERQYLGKTPEEIITDALVKRIARKVSQLALLPEFNSEAVIADITTTARDEMEAAFQGVVHEEKESRAYNKGKKYGSPTDPLLRHLEKTMGADVQTENVRLSVPDDFFESLATAMRDEKKTLDYLEAARAHPAMQAYLLPLLQKLSTFDKDGWHLKERGAEGAYNVIKPLADDMRYTIPPSEAELLYILTYLPSSVRHPAQELLVHHSYMSFVQEQRQAAEGKSEPTEMHDALLQFLKFGIFSNSHWQRLSNYEGSSETMNAELVEMHVQYKQIERRMMDIVQRDSAQAQVVQTFLDYAEGLYERIAAVHEQHGCYALQQTDIGHGFRTGFLNDCDEIIHPDSHAYRYRKKDGSMAAILEDDQTQMSNWKNLIQDHSTYSLPDDGRNVFETPSADLLELSNDPNVRLFLIDIQNRDDDTAGISVAEELLGKLMDAYRQQGGQGKRDRVERQEQRTVIVWSTSPELKRLADQHLKAFCSRVDSDEKFICRDNGNSPIVLRVQMKTDYIPFTA